MARTVDEMLDTIGVLDAAVEQEQQTRFADSVGASNNVTIDPKQAEEAAKNDLDFLAGLAMPEAFQYLFPPILQAAWQLVTSVVSRPRDFSQLALGIPRGFGKTTLIKLFIVYCILFTKKKLILIISSTSTHAENIVSDVFTMLDERNVKSIFGNWRAAIEVDRRDLKKFGFRERNIVVVAIGAGGSLRGLNLNNERPDVMVFEDIQTREDAKSEQVSADLEDWMVSTAMKAKSPHGCLTIFCGNMYPGRNSILKKLKTNKNWIKFIAGAILSDGTSLWEALRPIKLLLEELDNDISMGHAEAFFSEVLNETDVAINTRLNLSSLKKWPWSDYEIPQGRFIIVDPSSGKLGRDDAAIGLFEVYDGITGFRSVEEGSFSPKETILISLRMAIKNNVRCIACEATAYQSTLLFWFNEIAKELNIEGIEFVELQARAKSKNYRVGEMLKAWQKGDIFVHPSIMSLVVNQAVGYNAIKRDNIDGILDCMAYEIQVRELYEHLISCEENIEILEASSAKVSGVEVTSIF